MKLLFLLVIFGIASADEVRFDQYSVFRVILKTRSDVEIFENYLTIRPSLDVWKHPSESDTSSDVMVAPLLKEEFVKFLTSAGLEYEIFISDVQELIRMERKRKGTKLKTAFGWTQYYTLQEIESWLYDLSKKYKEVEVIIAGSTYEGRNITGVRLSYSEKNRNKAVFFESNIHAREWITSAVSTFILNEFLTSQDPEIRKLAGSYDWYFVPVANPDGFDYTQKNRTWRKTMRPSGWGCIGSDPNRNWDNHWAEYGTSSDPCDYLYPGSKPFSETCTRTLSQYISTIGDKLVAYFDFHAYAQLLMVPYGYSPEPLDNYNLTYSIGLEAAKSLAKRYGTQYRVGNIYNTVYPASGGSIDWVKATFGTPLAYVYELRDKGKYGFILPPDQIIPTSLETLDSIVTIFKEYEKRQKS